MSSGGGTQQVLNEDSLNEWLTQSADFWIAAREKIPLQTREDEEYQWDMCSLTSSSLEYVTPWAPIKEEMQNQVLFPMIWEHEVNVIKTLPPKTEQELYNTPPTKGWNSFRSSAACFDLGSFPSITTWSVRFSCAFGGFSSANSGLRWCFISVESSYGGKVLQT